jgi:hypothetical protein
LQLRKPLFKGREIRPENVRRNLAFGLDRLQVFHPFRQAFDLGLNPFQPRLDRFSAHLPRRMETPFVTNPDRPSFTKSRLEIAMV